MLIEHISQYNSLMNNNPLPKKHEMIFYTIIHNSRCDPAQRRATSRLHFEGVEKTGEEKHSGCSIA